MVCWCQWRCWMGWKPANLSSSPGFLIEGMNRISVDLSSNWFSRNLFSSCMMDLGSVKVYVNCRDSSIEALFVGERSSFKASHHDIQAEKVYIRFPLSISVVSFSVQEEAEQHYTKYRKIYCKICIHDYVCMHANTLHCAQYTRATKLI